MKLTYLTCLLLPKVLLTTQNSSFLLLLTSTLKFYEIYLTGKPTQRDALQILRSLNNFGQYREEQFGKLRINFLKYLPIYLSTNYKISLVITILL